MPKFIDQIFTRRSIRKYTAEPIAQEQIELLLQAAMSAPSAVAKDPWRFIVVTERETLRQIATGLTNGRMIAEAAAGVVVCGDISVAHDSQLSYLLQDCSAAIENLLLAAASLDLGACWLGVHPREERIQHIRELFDLSAKILPIACIALGHPGETKPARTRFKPEYVHYERWSIL